ncbi:hypothetical protein CRG98_007137 [Punica granatum]|uniref:Uncharacterized protein n=1 Tax=Punica granatum TaxID=22663 RepID=A0A2I0KVW3_PUNGR|nr:hypothetical protein CRG98_007137 [Punica granatum]
MSYAYEGSIIGVPFPWEDSPGIPKATPADDRTELIAKKGQHVAELPLPPCPSVRSRGLLIKLLQKDLMRQKTTCDPFVSALMKCTEEPSTDSHPEEEEHVKEERNGGDEESHPKSNVVNRLKNQTTLASNIIQSVKKCVLLCGDSSPAQNRDEDGDSVVLRSVSMERDTAATSTNRCDIRSYTSNVYI